MPYVVHHLPNLLVAEEILGGRHSRRKNTVLDNPVQLPVAVGLDRSRTERRNRRSHPIREWNASVLPIQPMAHHAVSAKVLLPLMNVLAGSWKGIRHPSTPNGDAPFRALHQSRLESAGSPGLAANQNRAGEQDRCAADFVPD